MVASPASTVRSPSWGLLWLALMVSGAASFSIFADESVSEGAQPAAEATVEVAEGEEEFSLLPHLPRKFQRDAWRAFEDASESGPRFLDPELPDVMRQAMVAEFVATLVSQGKKWNTVKSFLTAFNKACTRVGLPRAALLSNNVMLSSLAGPTARAPSNQTRQHRGMPLAIARSLAASYPVFGEQSALQGTVQKACATAVVLAWFYLLRPNEVVALRWSDVRFVKRTTSGSWVAYPVYEAGALLLHFGMRKNKALPSVESRWPSGVEEFCPVARLASWMAYAFHVFTASQAENQAPSASAAALHADACTRFGQERVFSCLSGDRFLAFVKAEGKRRGCPDVDAYSLRVGGAQQLKAQLDAQPSMSLLRDAGGWSSTSMPLYYGGHSIEGSELISAYMVRPVTALPK